MKNKPTEANSVFQNEANLNSLNTPTMIVHKPNSKNTMPKLLFDGKPLKA